jgi:hypothetical protein
MIRPISCLGSLSATARSGGKDFRPER